jgi:hypothetical protein
VKNKYKKGKTLRQLGETPSFTLNIPCENFNFSFLTQTRQILCLRVKQKPNSRCSSRPNKNQTAGVHHVQTKTKQPVFTTSKPLKIAPPKYELPSLH